jgi:hypothetical protein
MLGQKQSPIDSCGALCRNYLLGFTVFDQTLYKKGRRAILIIEIGFLKARLRRAFKKPILLFPALLALETTKLVS